MSSWGNARRDVPSCGRWCKELLASACCFRFFPLDAMRIVRLWARRHRGDRPKQPPVTAQEDRVGLLGCASWVLPRVRAVSPGGCSGRAKAGRGIRRFTSGVERTNHMFRVSHLSENVPPAPRQNTAIPSSHPSILPPPRADEPGGSRVLLPLAPFPSSPRLREDPRSERSWSESIVL